MSDMRREALAVDREPAVLAACLLPEMNIDPHDPLGELRSLAETAGAVVVDELMQARHRPDPASFIGSGKVDELADMVREHKAQVVIFDNDLSPSQLGHIEKIVECKVLDRSELILDIFASRARTNEARLQVELAQLEYTYPRLTAMWSHLERIAGGSPAGIGTRGPGEQQLEIDRRIVQRRKAELKREIVRLQARKEREVARRNQDHFTVSLVGYTNAGKSTLFNTATDGDAYADDKLFATLTTRTRRWDLGGGDQIMLSDTVGFVRDLPHHLVASFRATLEEAIHSDLLLLVLDVSHPRVDAQFHTVREVLQDIGAGDNDTLLVLNKVDRLDNPAPVQMLQQEHPGAIAISAKTGVGVPELVEAIRSRSRGAVREMTLALPLNAGKAVHYLETRGVVLDRQYEGDLVLYTVRLGDRHLAELKATGVPIRDGSGQLLGANDGRGWSTTDA